jgi:large subunit ribosomal protein L19
MSDKEVISPVNVEARKNLGIRSGDTVRVMQKIVEKGKTRLQAFEGLVLTVKHGTEPGATFTVRKVASGVGVEKTYPLYSPNIDQIEIIKRTKVRRSKLYYIREKASKEIRRAMRNAFMLGTTIESDIAEKERVANEEEEAKKAEEEAKEAVAKAEAEAKAAEEASKAEAETPAEEPKEETPAEPEVKEEPSTEEKKD